MDKLHFPDISLKKISIKSCEIVESVKCYLSFAFEIGYIRLSATIDKYETATSIPLILNPHCWQPK